MKHNTYNHPDDGVLIGLLRMPFPLWALSGYTSLRSVYPVTI